MNVKLITVGKTSASYLKEGELEYQNRLKHYMKFERIDLADLKVSHKITHTEIKKKRSCSDPTTY
jgi:23S rRNA (pseudouridine1915-N3)-methyltransferase